MGILTKSFGMNHLEDTTQRTTRGTGMPHACISRTECVNGLYIITECAHPCSLRSPPPVTPQLPESWWCHRCPVWKLKRKLSCAIRAGGVAYSITSLSCSDGSLSWASVSLRMRKGADCTPRCCMSKPQMKHDSLRRSGLVAVEAIFKPLKCFSSLLNWRLMQKSPVLLPWVCRILWAAAIWLSNG